MKINSYKTYLENQDFNSYPNNQNLRVKSQFQKQNLNEPPYKKHNNSINEQSAHKVRTSNSVESKKYKTYQFPSIERQNDDKTNKKRIRSGYITIPYNTEQLNRNVSKVLSEIQEIQSQFRKLSSRNSIHLKTPYQEYSFSEPKYKNNFIASLIQKIKKPINYEQKNDDYIFRQKEQLVKLVKNLNHKLNDKMKELDKQKRKSALKQSIIQNKVEGRRRIKTDIQEEGRKKNQRSPSALEFQKSLLQVLEQFNTNQKLIENMKQQLDFLNKKYEGYHNSLKNYKSNQQTVNKVKELIKMKKEEISKLRKKKFLTQRSIISNQKHNGSIFAINSKDIMSTNCTTASQSGDMISSLKQEYREALKKRDKLQNKIQLTKMHLNRIEELKDKNNVNKEHYQQLAKQIEKINQLNKQNNQTQRLSVQRNKNQKTSLSCKKIEQKQVSHIDFIYKTRKSKLQLLMNTIKRNEESYKKKYYKLLKQYEALVDQEQNSCSSSPLKALSQSKVNKSQENIVDKKLDKSRVNIVELQNKIERFSKIGKIVRKVNNNENTSFYQNQSYDQQQFQRESQLEDGTDHNSSSKIRTEEFRTQRGQITYTQHSSQSQTTPIKNNTRKPYNKLNDRIVSASSYIKSGESEINSKIDSQKYEKQSQYLTEGDKSFHDLYSGMEQPKINQTILHQQQRKKYIGKFKKQRIVQKLNKKIQQSGISSPKNKLSPTVNNKKKPYHNVEQPIIQEQIQAMNSLNSSSYKPKQSQVEEEDESDSQRKRIDVDDIAEKIEKENSQNEYHSDFSPQKQSQLLILQEQQNKQIKQQQIKQKFSKMLFKSKLFSS